MRDTYKAVLVMTLVPLLVVAGLSEACSNEVAVVFSTLLTAVSVGLWKWSKKS